MYTYGFPRWHNGKESTCQVIRYKRHMFHPWIRKITWSRKGQPALIFLPGKLHGQRNLVGYHPWGHKELDTTEHTHTHTPPHECYYICMCIYIHVNIMYRYTFFKQNNFTVLILKQNRIFIFYKINC